jgi:hypothetical protein
MTKGIAGGFALPGLFVFSLVSGRLVLLLNNIRVWLLAILALTLCLGLLRVAGGVRPRIPAGYMGQRTHQLPENTRRTCGGPALYTIYVTCLTPSSPGSYSCRSQYFLCLAVTTADAQWRCCACHTPRPYSL